MIPIVMGASKEAYNLFGPEVNIVLLVDDGLMVLTLIWQGSFIHVADFEGPVALGEYLQHLKNDSVAFLLSNHLHLIRLPGCLQQIL